MANYQATHAIALVGGTASGTASLSWSSTFDLDHVRPVTDRTPIGELDETDSIASSVFSGFYIDIDGAFYGVFVSGSTWIVPYNKPTLDISGNAAFSALITTNYAPTLIGAANCFLSGTIIATPGGARAIETLMPGDTIIAADGRDVAVVWVWRHDVLNIWGRDIGPAPIQISANALGPGCPSDDLTVTADHALLIDGMLINAGALLNGTTIRALRPNQLPPRFSYWHIETAAHDVIVAQGCAAETFLDYTGRAAYDSHGAYLRRYGADQGIAELPLARICVARHLPRGLRVRLGIDRAA